MARKVTLQALALAPVFFSAPVPGDDSVRFSQSHSAVPYQRTTPIQVVAEPVPIVVEAQPETVTVDKWHQPLSQPQRRKATQPQLVAYVPLVEVAAPEEITVDKWLAPLSQPVRIPQKLQQLASTYVPVVETVPPVPGDDSVRFSQSNLIVRYDKSRLLQSIADPVPIVTPAAPETVTVDSWFRPLSQPPDGGTVQIDLSFTFFAVEYPYDWYRPLSEPSRRKTAPHTSGIVVYDPPPVVPETITVDKWFSQFSQPVKRRPLRESNGVLVYDPPAVVPPQPGDDSVRFSQFDITVRYDRSLFYQSVADPVPIVETVPEPPVVEPPFSPGGGGSFTKERYRKLIDELRQARLDALAAAKDEDGKAKAALKKAAAETQKVIELTDERNDDTHRLAMLLESAAAADKSQAEIVKIANQAAALARALQDEFEEEEIAYLLL